MKFCLLLLSIFSAFPAFAKSRYNSLEVRDWADYIFQSPDRPDELNDPALSAVTREFGPTLIPLSKLPIETAIFSADTTPWSSWWFPKIDRDLFEDGLGTSPLEKYDYVRSALTGNRSRAAELESNGYSPNRPRWEGLCDAWALAATLVPEPISPRKISLPRGALVSFSVGDQKALLLKTFDSVPIDSLKVYGQRFTGTADGWIFPDIFPQELHRYVEKQLFEKKKPFVMDHDPGVEVWSEPVFRANYKITALQGRTDAVAVRLWLYSAGSFASQDQKDKVGVREIVREYDYRLYGTQDGAGNLVVTSGTWEKGELVDSRRDHPDFVFSANDLNSVKRFSQNPEIDSAMVDKIIGR